MDEFRDLDRMLEEVPLPIPEEAVDTVSPWPAALKKVLWGFVLNAITIHHWNLQYLLPAVGVVLLWLGWRSLREENLWLRRGWLASLALLAERLAVGILRATPLMGGWAWGWTALSVLNILLVLTQYLCLWLGLRAVFQKAGQPPKTGAAAGLLAWDLALAVLSLLAPRAGNLVYGGMLVGYLGLLHAMGKVAHCLDEAGYALESAPVKVPAKTAVKAGALALAAVLGVYILAFDRFPQQAERPVPDSPLPTELAELDRRLIELGYPEELLADLSEEDRRRCLTAVGVDAAEFNAGQWEDHSLLRMRTIQVVLADGSCRVFNHFRWEEAPRYRGLESLEVLPMMHNVGVRWEDVSTRLLYQRDSQTYETQFASLEEIHGPTECISGYVNFGKILAEFSLPKGGEKMRGYVAYDLIQEGDDRVNFNLEMNYTRQVTPLRYPWMSPLDYRDAWGLNPDKSFHIYEHDGLLQMHGKGPAWQAVGPK